MSLTHRVWRALRAPTQSYFAENNPQLSEPRLVAFAFGASLFLTLGRVLAETIRPEVSSGEERIAWFAATILIGFSFGILAYYAAAALIRIMSRILGGSATWADTRLALFWSGCAAGPLIAIGYIIGAALDGRSLAATIGGAIWAIWFIPMLAVANGFKLWKVIAIFLSVCAVLLVAPTIG